MNKDNTPREIRDLISEKLKQVYRNGINIDRSYCPEYTDEIMEAHESALQELRENEKKYVAQIHSDGKKIQELREESDIKIKQAYEEGRKDGKEASDAENLSERCAEIADLEEKAQSLQAKVERLEQRERNYLLLLGEVKRLCKNKFAVNSCDILEILTQNTESNK